MFYIKFRTISNILTQEAKSTLAEALETEYEGPPTKSLEREQKISWQLQDGGIFQ